MSDRRCQRQFRYRLRGEWCTYCGNIATLEDHFPPLSLMLEGWLLPACAECNAFAGTVWARDFEARCRHVNFCIRRKYKKLLETPAWSRDELDELEHTLRSAVIQWEGQRKIAQERIAWNVGAYLACIDHNNAFVL